MRRPLNRRPTNSRPPTRKAGTGVKRRSFAIYGRSGTGKTTLACSFPGPVYLIDINDDGDDSVADIKDLEIAEPKTWQEMEDHYWYLKKGDHDFQTVIIDTITNMQQLAIVKILESKKKRTDNAGDWGTMTKREWGDVAQLMKTWIDNWKNLDMEVVFNAQDRLFNVSDEDDEESQLDPEVGPRLSPSVKSALNAAVSFIGNTFIRQREVIKEVAGKKKHVLKTEYCLRVGPNSVYITKVRKPKGIELPSVIVDPTYDDIVDLIKGE